MNSRLGATLLAGVGVLLRGARVEIECTAVARREGVSAIAAGCHERCRAAETVSTVALGRA
jgi:hypothetical protein